MRYYLVAGEASGDLHGSNLMRGLYARDPDADIRFWGGGLMDAVYRENQPGSGLVRDYREGAVLGIWEVIVQARKLLRRVRFCEEDIAAWKPDVVILIDYPGFNFRIAGFAHKAGFKVFWYIAPKVWASREGRIRKLKAYVDKLFIVFPFEIDYFKRKGVDFIYRGNPLVDAVDRSEALHESREAFLRRHGLEDKPVIALLAGSRSGEIKTMMPTFMQMAARLHATPEYAGYQFLIAAAPSRTREDYDLAGNDGFVQVVSGDTYGVLHHARAAVINSGTASLEAALIGTPQVVAYRTSALTALIARIILKIKYVSLANLILDRGAFHELLQEDFTTDRLVAEVRRLVEDEGCRSRMMADYAEVRELLGGTGASESVAEAMIGELR
ncbi:MAG: lipid-A-disaccharide synthase [Bacteroidales bacterium]|nr:lipid-A-disaccharide synthase [Bacteroidales bacterium]MBR6864771.1 lipid-A-disaccharide synthase [Bacteroidales bacterium]